MDPCDFGGVSNLFDQIKDLGLSQVGAPDIVNLDHALNADVMQEGDDVQEDFFHGGVVYHEWRVFTIDVKLEQVN